MEAVHMRVNAPQVIHESIDGEVIIINLTTGNYYSTKGSGADVWDLIEQSPGLTSGDVVDALELRFDASVEALAPAVDAFVTSLRAEGLVVDTEAGIVASERPPLPHGSAAFIAPMLEKFTDMQDLVLLDPVHEVDATGWPQPRPDASVSGASA